jgi:regulator of sirC expression with transglutaminase-like and TPR domain
MEKAQALALISLLDDEDQEILQHVEEQIRLHGEKMIPHLEQVWESSFSPLVQRRIEDILHQLQFDLLKTRLTTWVEAGAEDLVEGLCLVASFQYPDLNKDKIVAIIEQLYYDVWVEMGNDQDGKERVRKLNEAFFQKLRFSGNTKNFHSPANSMINQVLETKKGNPITLCALYLLIAQKLNYPIYGVNLPNLFVLLYRDAENSFYINVFNRGLIFTKEEIDRYLSDLKLEPRSVYFEPCTHREIIARVLRNLVVSFEKLSNQAKVEEVQILLHIVAPEG